MERARRLNDALEMLGSRSSDSEAASELAARHGISKRQAYRYLRQARKSGRKVPVPDPDPKVAFTVKLSRRVVEQLRGFALSEGLSLGEVVKRALQAFLKGRGRG